MRLDLKTDNAEHQNKFNFELITKKNAMKNIDMHWQCAITDMSRQEYQ